MRISFLESFLIQIIIYSLIWYLNEYVGSLLSIILPPIALALLLISYITEKIEPSKIPPSYFKHMWIFVISPLGVGIFFYWVYDGNLDWLTQ